MFKKIILFLLVLTNFAAATYLLSPLPSLPDLPQSLKSDEPGDTTQIPHLSAYYTNLSRQEVMKFYRQHYLAPLVINLNHPPEKAKSVIRDTIRSYYFEELIIPFKESLYVNGFDWEKDVFTKPEKRIKNKIIYQDREFQSKITIRRFPTHPAYRLASFFGLESLIGAMIIVYPRIFRRQQS
jgi:hypothetical protein